jgi:hypothetical protein
MNEESFAEGAQSFMLTLGPDEMKRLDHWIADRDGDKPTRPEAVRMLLNLLLA